MTDSRIILKSSDFYVGERVHVEIRLFDELAKEQATGADVLLVLTRPDKTTLQSTMTEAEGEEGLYRGSAVVDAEGRWRVEVKAADGESVFRHDRLYVSA